MRTMNAEEVIRNIAPLKLLHARDILQFAYKHTAEEVARARTVNAVFKGENSVCNFRVFYRRPRDPDKMNHYLELPADKAAKLFWVELAAPTFMQEPDGLRMGMRAAFVAENPLLNMWQPTCRVTHSAPIAGWDGTGFMPEQVYDVWVREAAKLITLSVDGLQSIDTQQKLDAATAARKQAEKALADAVQAELHAQESCAAWKEILQCKV